MSFRRWSSLACAALVASLSVGCASGGLGDDGLGDDGGGSGTEGGPSGDASNPGADTGHEGGRDAGGSDATTDTQPAEQNDSSAADSGLEDDTGTTVVDSGSPGPDGSTSTCNPSNCASGCCQGNNCIGGTANNACGLTGAVCADCTQIPNGTCVSGLCEAPSSNCSSTCSGCCDSSNVCHATSSPQACFTNGGNPFTPGSACEDCTAEGDLLCIKVVIAYTCAL